MKAKKLLPFILSATAFAFGVSGCSDYDNDYTETDILYAQNFEQVFGKVDPNQDWNLLAQLANANKNGTRSGYTGGSYSIGSVVVETLPESQAAPLTTEQMKSYEKMLPEIGSTKTKYSETNLGRVTQDFTARTQSFVLYPVYWQTSGADIVGLYYYADASTPNSTQVTDIDGNTKYIVKVPITVGKPTELEYSYHQDTQWEQVYDQNVANYLHQNWQTDVVNANSNFVISNGNQFTQYGEYDTSGKLLVCKGKKTLSYDSPAGVAGTEFDYYDVAFLADYFPVLAEQFPAMYKNETGNYYVVKEEAGNKWDTVVAWLGANAGSGNTNIVDPIITEAEKLETSIVGFRSKGIKVTLPANIQIGFYIENNGTSIMYSEGSLNYQKLFSDKSEKVNACHVATYESETETDKNGKKLRYLAFEDWKNDGDFDLNDIVFRAYGLETIVDNEEISEEGLFVCEDLGAFDFDFNDIVLKAKWRRYYKKTYTKDPSTGVITNVEVAQYPSDDLTITAMAAGGANRSDVYFKTKTGPTTGVKLGEIHQLLGGEAPSIINAGSRYGSDGESYTIQEEEFPTTWNSSKYPNGYVSQVFDEGNLYVIASTDNSIAQPEGAYNVEATRIIKSDNYKTSGVPQMMLLPMYYEWCQESQPIDEVYTHFTDWVSDATKADWLVNGKVESRTTDRGVTPATYQNNIPAASGNDDGGSGNADPYIADGYKKLTQQNNVDEWKRGFDLSSLKSEITSGNVEIIFVASGFNQKCTVHLGSSSDVTTWANWEFTKVSDTEYKDTKAVSDLTTDYIYCCSANSEATMYYKAVE